MHRQTSLVSLRDFLPPAIENEMFLMRMPPTSGIPYMKNGYLQCILPFRGNTVFPDETEGILCQKIPVHCMRPDPASTPTETPETAIRASAPEPGLFFTEPCENRIGSVSPYHAERCITDVPCKKMLRTGKLARIHIPV